MYKVNGPNLVGMCEIDLLRLHLSVYKLPLLDCLIKKNNVTVWGWPTLTFANYCDFYHKYHHKYTMFGIFLKATTPGVQ